MIFPSRLRHLIVAIATAVAITTVAAPAASAGEARKYCTSGGVNCAVITTDVSNGVASIEKFNTRVNLIVNYSFVIDHGQYSHLRGRDMGPFWFQVGSSADAICFDIKDDGKDLICHWNVT